MSSSGAGRVAGTRIIKMREIIIELYGAAALERALARVPAAAREEYASASSLGWVRASTDYAVLDALAEELNRDGETLHREILWEAMERTFKTLWRVFLRFTSDESLIVRARSIYSRTRDTGEMSAKLVGPGVAEIRITNYPGMTARDAKCIAVGLEAALVLTGRKNVVTRMGKVEDGVLYTVRWR